MFLLSVVGTVPVVTGGTDQFNLRSFLILFSSVLNAWGIITFISKAGFM